MNILFLTYQGDVTGSTNSIAFLCKGLADRGHNVYLGCRKESLLYSLLKDTKVNLIEMVFKGKFDIQNIKHIKNIVNAYDIQIINAQSSKDRYNSIWSKWFFGLNVKVVHTRRQRPRSIGGYLQNMFYVKGTNKIVVISDELKKQFVKLGIPEQHLKVIYNGTPKERYENLDLNKVEELKKKYGIKDEDTVIGSISRIKNQDQIIKSLKYLPADIKLFLIGVPINYYDALVKKLGVKNKIIYTGTVPVDEVLAYYKLLKVNILASTMDGFGLVLTEAMALETPVIATNFGGIKNVIDNEVDGLLFDDNDIEGLAKQIQRLLTDDLLRQKLIKNGKRKALVEFSMDKT
ncbi:MAG: glycosyltransferase family 4 protein, partial [Cyclobacteriaceae bacterium]